MPQLVRLQGHNHFSGTAALNAVEGELDRQMGVFLELTGDRLRAVVKP